MANAKPAKDDIVLKHLGWNDKCFVGMDSYAPDQFEVRLTLCGPCGGYSHTTFMTPEQAEEVAHALLAKAEEVRNASKT